MNYIISKDLLTQKFNEDIVSIIFEYVPKPTHIMCDLVKKYKEQIIDNCFFSSNPLIFTDNIEPFLVFCCHKGELSIGSLLWRLENRIIRNKIIEAYKCRISFSKIAELFNLYIENEFNGNYKKMTKKQIEKEYNINFNDFKKCIVI